MSWLSHHLDPSPAHWAYLIVAAFLILYASLSSLIRNRLHLSEPPLATLVGVVFGPQGVALLNPSQWGLEDNITQETSRLVVGLQVFSVGVELPRAYMSHHWRNVALLLGPVMTFSWLVAAALVYFIIDTHWTTAMIVGACLSPTDPVLAASVLAESAFSAHIPTRVKHLLAAESGCNDGISFPFLFLGIMFMVKRTDAAAVREWLLGTLLWQCLLGISIGLVLGTAFNYTLRRVERLELIDRAAFLCFYLLLAVLAVGIGSTLGVDDFLVAFGAGYGFARDGWFRQQLQETHLPQILDLLLNSAMFVYFGAQIPWPAMASYPLSPLRLILLAAAILLLRRIPVMLAVKPYITDIHSYKEALFCGHFGPMGLGALFLAIEARARLDSTEQTRLIWPTVSFIILSSIVVHGLSPAAISALQYFVQQKHVEETDSPQQIEPYRDDDA